MTTRTLQVIKSGAVLDAYSLEEYKFGIVFGTITIQDRKTNEILVVFSPYYFDKVEVCSDDSED